MKPDRSDDVWSGAAFFMLMVLVVGAMGGIVIAAVALVR